MSPTKPLFNAQDSDVTRLEGLLDRETRSKLKAGDTLLYSGVVYTARDAAHQRLCEALERGEEPPFPLEDAVIYYAGPAPAKPGAVIGSVGPTSSYRMDPYTPQLLDRGVAAMIGKGVRGPAVVDAIKRNSSVYFSATGGIAALMAKCVRDSVDICYGDLGTEAVRRLIVVDLPLTVAIDANGASAYELGPERYLSSLADAQAKD